MGQPTRTRFEPVPLHAGAEAENNPVADIVLSPNCGHSIMSENPDGVRRHLRQLITSHKRLT